MKKFFEKIKDIKNIIKFISFFADCMNAIVEVYNRHYPNQKVENNVGGSDK